MKRIYLLLFGMCWLLVQESRAQYLGLHLGWALPSGTFGNSNLNDTESGFAQTGYTYGFTANYRIIPNLSICADISKSVVGFNTKDYMSGLQNANPLVKYDLVVPDGYIIHSGLMGVQGQLERNRWSFGIRFMMGFVDMKAPEKRVTQELNGMGYVSVTESRSDMAMAFAWGISGTYHLSEYLYVLANVQQMAADTDFDFVYRSANQDRTAIPLNMFQATFGLGIHIQDN